MTSARLLVLGLSFVWMSSAKAGPTAAEIYVSQCREANPPESRPLDPNAQCNGMPFLFYLAKTQNVMPSALAPAIVADLVASKKLDPHVREAGTGRLPLFVAVAEHNFSTASALLFFTNMSVTDDKGQSVLNFMAANPLSLDFQSLPQAGEGYYPSQAHLPGPEGKSPLQIADEIGYPGFRWYLISSTGKIEGYWVPATNPSAFFSSRVEKYINVVDASGPVALQPFTGSYWDEQIDRSEKRTVRDYGLIHFASEKGLPKLIDYLIGRGVDLDGVSSLGTPLALALRSYVTFPVNSGRRASIESAVQRLLQERKAILAQGVFGGAIAAGRVDWIQTVLRAGAEISMNDDLIVKTDNGPLADLLVKIYRTAAKSERQGLKSKFRDLLDREKGGLSKMNPLNQSYAHIFAYVVPPNEYTSLVYGSNASDSFENFLNVAETRGLLDQADELRMLPLHYWLANPARRAVKSSSQDREDLRELLGRTRGYLSLDVNNDSILTYAVRSGREDLVEFLLRRRSDLAQVIKLPNLQGRSPLDYAKEIKGGMYALLKEYL